MVRCVRRLVGVAGVDDSGDASGGVVVGSEHGVLHIDAVGAMTGYGTCVGLITAVVCYGVAAEVSGVVLARRNSDVSNFAVMQLDDDIASADVVGVRNLAKCETSVSESCVAEIGCQSATSTGAAYKQACLVLPVSAYNGINIATASGVVCIGAASGRPGLIAPFGELGFHETHDVSLDDGAAVNQGLASAGCSRRGGSGSASVAGIAIGRAGGVAALALTVQSHASASHVTGAGVHRSFGVGSASLTAGVHLVNHTIDDHCGLTTVHGDLTAEAAVGVTTDDAQGIYGSNRVTILAGDAVVVANLGNGGVLVSAAGGEAVLVHDIGHELCHVIAVDALVHGGAVNDVCGLAEAGAGQDAVDSQGDEVGEERTVLEIALGVAHGDFVGIECTGQHDGEVGAGDGVSGPEGAIGIAADDAVLGTPDDAGVEGVGAGDVGEADQCGHGVTGGGPGLAGIADSTARVASGAGGEGRDCQRECHDQGQGGRENAAERTSVGDTHVDYLTFNSLHICGWLVYLFMSSPAGAMRRRWACSCQFLPC